MDEDIKIVGIKPSVDVKRNKSIEGQIEKINSCDTHNALLLGEYIAEEFCKEENKQNESNSELMFQRTVLLSFTADVSFDKYCRDEGIANIARHSFDKKLDELSKDLYKSSMDTSAFSFYYLAYRGGRDIERRIGQTFAMLCSHDGDPIFQELGEALFCWFSSLVMDKAAELGINKK